MDMKELRKKNIPELWKMIEEKSTLLNNFRFGTSGSKVKNTQEGKNLRRDIAQIQTVMREIKASQVK